MQFSKHHFGADLSRSAPFFILSLFLALSAALLAVRPSRARIFEELPNSRQTSPPLVSASGGGRLASPKVVDNSALSVDSLTPVVGGARDAEAKDAEFLRGEGRMRRFGTFAVSNAAGVPFVLRIVFEDGRQLRFENERVSRVFVMRLEDIEVRYRNVEGGVVRRALEWGVRGSAANVCELRFWLEDVQEEYEFELWASINEGDHRVARRSRDYGGVYTATVSFDVERLPVGRIAVPKG